ncbi:PAS domain-containing sensor histidine kinase [Pararhodospirillum photometricum]|uniref:histidine kinase n=1 Tax=Pararhodospirillum photometricum DSM 122 TaxID=1150469 RepID=H6SNY9_PARPM|nr:PAS domain S-box protein [Pararhodospirillum photometricum]CCG07061.1 Sensor protein [Pararhodospirillum photometricum DSM 122]
MHDATKNPRPASQDPLPLRASAVDRLAGIGRWHWDQPQRTLACCDAMRALLDGDDLEGIVPLRTLLRRIPVEDRRLLWRALRRVRDGAQTLRLTIRVRRPNGSWLHLRALAVADRDQTGRLGSLLGLGQDVTRQVEAALALAASETRYRGILESAGDPIFVYDQDGKVIDANPQACAATAYTLEELRGRPISFISPYIAEAEVIRSWRELIPGRPVTRQGVHRRKDGSEYPVEVRVGVFVSSGERHFVAIARDISERQRIVRETTLAAQRFRAIFDLDLIGVGVLDTTRRWLEVNDVLLTLLGRERAELIGRSWSAVLDAEDRLREDQLWRDMSREGRSSYAVDLHLRDARGRPVPVRLSMGAARGGDGLAPQYILLVQDLSERRAWEAAKAESEARLRSLINATTDAIALLDPDGTIRVLNRAGARLLGTTSRQALGRSFYGFLDRGRAVTHRHVFHDVLSTQLPVNREERWGERWMDIVVFPVLDGNGKAMGLTLYARDVTRRRETEQRLQDNEARLRGAFDSAVHGIALLSLQGGFLRVNGALCRIVGQEAALLLSADHSVLGQPDPEHDEDPLDALLGGRSPDCSVERRLQRPDGTEAWIHVAGSIVRAEDNTPLHVVVHVQDITLRRQAEKRARTAESHLLEAAALMSEGLLLFDEDNRLVLYNEAYLRQMPELTDVVHPGVSRETIVRRVVDDGLLFVSPDPLEAQEDQTESTIDHMPLPGMGPRTSAPREFRRPDGRWYLVRTSRTGAGYTLVLGSDITDLKTREHTLASAKEAAELANRAKSEFLANMSHELRTPLNAIIGFSDIIQNTMFGAIGNPVYAEYARRIHESGLHLLDIISDILDLSKIEAGELTLEEAPVALAPLGEETRQMLLTRAELKGIHLLNAIAPDLPALWADALRLKQILINLMTNAVKYTPEGGEVVVRASVRPEGGVTLSVEDNGIGMDAEGIRIALTPFGQVESTYTRRQGGTGLGLPLTAKLVDAHDGLLEIQSSPGRGTTVSALFPSARTIWPGVN